MADLSDVEHSLVATISQLVYPTGTANPSIVNTPCRVYRGWPIPASLDADLAAGTINVSVYPQDKERNTTRYPTDWQTLTIPTPALTLNGSATAITVGGTPTSPLNAAALVNGTAYVYAVQPGDSLTAIATGLAALISADTPATSSGPIVTVPAARQLTVRVGVMGTIIRETRRQERGFQITFWCPTPGLRDQIVPPIDTALAAPTRLTLPDGSSSRLIYERSPVTDRVQREGLYRRDLFYTVEYATTETQTAPQIVAERFAIGGGLDPNDPSIKTFSI